MSDRTPLAGSVLLCGEGDDGRFQRRFTIVREVGRGASAISYEALYRGSSRGILKEFYPADGPGRRYGLERDAEGQLISNAQTRGGFLEAQARYLAPYQTMLEARLSSREDDVLGTFIPAFEIYYGCNPESTVTGTVYIWTPEKELTTFDKVCAEIRAHPDLEPERKLYRALNAVRTLTDCICALHMAELLHRDIKPSNFGFESRGGELLTQSLTMFDVNSICSVYDLPEECLGSEGFAAPEAGAERLDNRADIYSIGATLYYAVIVTGGEGAEDGCFREEDYGRLKELVDTSRLIQASEGNSHPRLRNMLTAILRRCLAPEREDRYPACEELRADLDRAIRYLLPGRFSSELLPGEKLVLVSDVEKSLDRNREKNSLLAFQYLLYRFPLYRWSPAGEPQVRVLVVGFGGYGQKFLDVCLQAGQMQDKRLEVTVVSADATDQELYLQDRPGLPEFFDIGEPEGEDSYGRISFRTAQLSKTDLDGNRSILEDLALGSWEPQYVFIALGDDGLNAGTARACAAAVRERRRECFVGYVQEDEGAEVEGAVPVPVNQDAVTSPLYPEIERMAFNTHLVWEKDWNPDRKAVHANFRKPYNHDSCVASVLSIKYKLWGLGIDLEQCTPEEAAKAFYVLSGDRKRREVKNQLIWLEHRRWVTEKLCAGWTRLRDFQGCMAGPAKDERKKQHVCIAKSRPGPFLSARFSGPRGYEKWDSASEEELSALDDLDRMSVELHRAYVRRGKELADSGLLTDGALLGLRSMAEGDRAALRAFREWHACVKEIYRQWYACAKGTACAGENRARQYRPLRNAFLGALSGLPESVQRSVKKQLEGFEAVFYPVLASMEYRDYKLEDVNLVNAIPFILTYSESISLILPFAVGDITDVFGNVASATAINPERIYYLFCLYEEKEIPPLKEALSYVTGYLERKGLRAELELAVACPDPDWARWTGGLEEALKGIGGRRLRGVKLLPAQAPEAVAGVFRRYLSARRHAREGYAELNDTKLSHMLVGAGFYQALRRYRFDPVSQKFHACVGCDLFHYLRKDRYISAADLAAFQNASGGSLNQPEFFEDYKRLWETYRRDTLGWKRACTLLAEYAAQNDEIAIFETGARFGQEPQRAEYRYILPLDCRPAVARLLAGLAECRAVEPESTVRGGFTGACEVVVYDKNGNRQALDRLFSNPYALLQPDALQVYRKGGKARVVFDDLIVRRLDIRNYRGYSEIFERVCAVLRFWAGCRYVSGLSIEDGVVSFTYATRPIKALLTSAGRILEIYVYHKAKETGVFDDVVSSFELDWAQEDVKNEFDCILTKGFCTLFVECKARPVIDQDYYFKLSCLAKKFGIHAKAVLIADTQERDWQDSSAVNRVQRKRGAMLDVITIWKPIEIGNIGSTLLNIINGGYAEEEM